MTKADDFEIYKDISNLNHIMRHNEGQGFFNPCSMIMFSPNTKNPLISNLIFQHEFAHARLSSCIYGKISFFFRFITLDLVNFCILNNKPIEKYWGICENFKRVTDTLLKNWVLCQEGNATFTELQHLNSLKNYTLYEYQEKIERFLKNENPYSIGLSKIEKISKIYPNAIFRNLIQQIGNIDYTLLLPNLIQNSSEVIQKLPDNLLEQLTETFDREKLNQSVIIEYEKNLFIMKQESELVCKFAQNILKERLEVSFFDDDNKSLFSELIKIIEENIELYEYKFRISELVAEYETNAIEQLKNGGPNQILAYNTKQVTKSDIFFDFSFTENFVTEKETNSINYLINLSDMIQKYLPNNTNLFIENYRKLQLIYERNYDFLLRIFPPVENYRFKESNYNKYLNFNLYRVRNQTINNAKLFIMNQIKIKCTPSDAKNIETQFKEANNDSQILIDSELPNEGFGHWIETTEVIVTIIASTITIIDTIRKWLSNDNNERTIIINNFQLNTNIDQQLIESELKKMETIIIENKEERLKVDDESVQ